MSLRGLVRGRAPRLYAGLGRLRRGARRGGDDAPVAGGSRPGAAGQVDKADRALVEEIRSAAAGGSPNIALLTDGTPSDLTRPLTQEYRRAVVREYDVRVDASRLHARLAADGPFHVIVDDTGRSTNRVALLRSVFFHSRRSGVYVVRHHRQRAPRQRLRMSDFVAGLEEERGRPAQDPTTRPERDRRELVEAVERVVVQPRNLFLTSARQAAAKLTEPETNELLRLRPERGRVLEVLPATELRSRATVASGPGGLADWEIERYQVPELSLREYHDVTCLFGQVLAQRNVLLPDTFRHNQHRRLTNKFLQERAARFAEHKEATDATHLEGAYFYLDSEFRGHFGHAVTEQLSRLWAWAEAKRREPTLKALMLENLRTHLAEYEVLLYAAAGVPPEDLVLVKGPVTVDRLYAATPMFSQPAYVHPGVEAVWERTGGALAAAAPERDYPERIFVSRRHDKRPCHNLSEVEAFFAERGFEVIYPEDYALPEQARLFREAKVIGGFAGSGLFHTMLCDTPKHVVMVCSDAYTAKNEQMIAAVRGHRVDVAWCRSDALRPGSGWSKGPFHSPFTFDVTREGAWLDTVLKGG